MERAATGPSGSDSARRSQPRTSLRHSRQLAASERKPNVEADADRAASSEGVRRKTTGEPARGISATESIGDPFDDGGANGTGKQGV
jgi:hypothetical protein